MGLLRVLLALAVYVGHADVFGTIGFVSIGGDVAVEAFFMISGFYMALILDDKYAGKSGVIHFYTNRFLKLFPIYFVLLLARFILIKNGQLMVEFSELDLFSKTSVALSNLSLLGQDALHFIQNTPNGHQLVRSLSEQNPLSRFLLIPPSWTLSLEIYFYLMAPVLVRKSNIILFIIFLGSLLARVLIYQQGLTEDPWSYRFFPAELMFFIAGVFLCRAYSKFRFFNAPLTARLLLALCIIQLFTPGLFSSTIIMRSLFLVSVAAAIPFVFALTKKSSFDRKFGELSYPIYMVHIFCISLATKFSYDSWTTIGLQLVLIFSASYGLYFLIAQPIEKIRLRISQS